MSIEVLVFLLSFLVWPVASAEAGESVLLTNGEWPPYHSQHLAGGGVGSMLYTEAFALAGIDVEYRFMPWKRAYGEAESGNAHGSVSWLKHKDRVERFLYSEPVLESRQVFFFDKSTGFDWKRPYDLKDLRIAVIHGDASGKRLSEIVRSGSGRIEAVRTDAQGMKLLLAGRVDVCFCDERVGQYLLETTFSADAVGIVGHPLPFNTGENHLIISKVVPNGEQLIERFNRGLNQLKESGRYDRIFDLYFIPACGL